MYPPMELDAGAQYYMKPMNCPFHNLVFAARGRSYRELPLRLFEFGTVYRYEKSGVVHGLTRARGFTQDDAHIYCTRKQMGDELDRLLTFVLDLLRDYGLADFYLELSTRDPHKSIGSDEVWAEATETLQAVAEKQGLELVMDPGGAAFYGPKISVQARDAIGRTWQMSTIQLDFNLPERFDLEYQAADGSRQRPVMIHRALMGSYERFIGILLEHTAGDLPFWLAPVQARVLPVVERIDDSVEGIAQGTLSPTAVGGMATKIQAAKIVTRSGIPLVIASGHKPGVLADITRILADLSISIDAMVQKEPSAGEERVDIIMLTHQTREKNINAAIAKIEALSVVTGKVTRIRLEELG